MKYQKEVIAEIEGRTPGLPPSLTDFYNKLLNEAKQDLESYSRGECPDFSDRQFWKSLVNMPAR